MFLLEVFSFKRFKIVSAFWMVSPRMNILSKDDNILLRIDTIGYSVC